MTRQNTENHSHSVGASGTRRVRSHARGLEFERRFANRAGKVSDADGFEGFQLLRPNDDRDFCLVVTQRESEEHFRAWMAGPDFVAGHTQHRKDGPVGTGSELWSFDVLETQVPERA